MSSCKNDKLSTATTASNTTATDNSLPAAGPINAAGSGGAGGPSERQQIFQPALSVQRYQWVQAFLEKRPDIKSITDAGCGNGRMLLWLKTIRHLESIKLIDSDAAELEPDFNCHLQPAMWDLIFGRKQCIQPLRVEVFHGDLGEPLEELRSECFTLVEVVEHLEPEAVERCVRAVFAYYQPKLVIVTTPNREFNHLLRAKGEPADRFRHSDHKFEWTRAEFAHWCSSVTQLYPDYSFQLHGVGHLPHSHPFGPCTQIATFTRCQHATSATTKQQQQPPIDQPPEQPPIEAADLVCSAPARRKATERVLDYEIPADKSAGDSQDAAGGAENKCPETW